jgi:nucleoside-diphosphate-sugar epimerase
VRIAITGGTGFVGGHLAERLSRMGHDVVCVSRDIDERARRAPVSRRDTLDVHSNHAVATRVVELEDDDVGQPRKASARLARILCRHGGSPICRRLLRDLYLDDL